MRDSVLGAQPSASPQGGEATLPSAGLAPDSAVATLGFAVLLGIAGDFLLRLGLTGPGLPLWIGLVTFTLVALTWRADLPLPREAAFWLVVAIACATGMVWRNAEMVQLLDACGAMGALVLAAAATNRAGSVLFAPRLRDSVHAFFFAGWRAATGFVPLVLREAPAAGSAVMLTSRVARGARAVAIASVLLLLFGALLRSADPIFASLIAWPDLGDDVIPHLIVITVLAVALAGWMRSALLQKDVAARGSKIEFFQLNSLEVTSALGALALLFSAFIVVQLGWLFGGEQFLRERTGLTAAQYARGGFFQMVCVVTLVIPLLVATRAALTPGRELARRHTLLSMPIVFLLGAIIVSAAMRLNLYVRYYGLSVDRVYPLVFMAWLAFVLVWLAITVLRTHGPKRLFTAGAALSALATLASLNAVAPDRIVANINVARAAERMTKGAEPLDLAYLATLSGEAADIAVRAVLAAPTRVAAPSNEAIDPGRCSAARTLLARWGPTSATRAGRDEDGAWRSWNAGEARGLRAVGPHAAELRRVMHDACKRPTEPAGR